MKNIFLSIGIILITQTYLSSQWIYGGGMKFNTNDDFKALALNAKIGKDISEQFDVNVDISYYLASKATWSFDFDLQYRLFNINDRLIINPVAGINFTRTAITNNSLLLGASIKVPDDDYTYFIEPKWILDYKQFIFSIGVLF